ncbi:MAG: hypothetical protein JSV84_03235 [Gemmatimonadota bacterium]|nr:MAG: hypothetical protein JSV84_03235 [Gemmatimonadota bacterium]
MTCTKYQLYWDGKIPEKEFEIHRAKCDECREAYALDGLIEGEARKLPAPESSPWLWTRIENELKREQEKSRSIGLAEILLHIFSPRQHLIYKIAALLVISIGVSYLLFLRPTPTGPASTNFLTSSALSKVEEREKEYEQAIAELEKATQSLVANADTDLLLLYRDKLETIDAQIERCKEALKHNSADAHIRRYLLAAYQDKKETLIELIEITQG